ncbi:uncharacterized protein LOC123870296 [Maniola jurtina]|uniref:uncharacterized protein LOC123870296 n=1 Tax=Maniola jurtina TaxID=191418 RepID=UPI001E68DDD9|nr:uncharacterized protein LOC123870296 [Maniola jurtina]
MELEELLKLFENVEDITDPSLMDNILARLEEIQAEDDEFMQILLKKQHLMVITWHQPWYQKFNSLTRAMKPINHDEKDTFRTDSISSEESKKIHKNWKKFQKIFGVPNKPICLARWRNKEKSRNPNTAEECVRRFVISFLARGLERNLCQVYKYVVTHYGVTIKGNYSKNEENIMEVCAYHCPKNAVPYLAAVLSRECRGIYKRISQMAHGNPYKQVSKRKWTLPLATKLLKLLMEYTGETVVDNLKQRRFERSIWLKLEKDMEQYNYYLQRFWHDQLHIQLFVKADVKTRRLKRKIFKVLKHYPYKVWTDIRWKQVAKHFPDGFSPVFLNKVCYSLIYKSFPGYRKQPLEDVINYGIEKTKFCRNRRLKNLVLNESQELEFIRYDNKLKLIF